MSNAKRVGHPLFRVIRRIREYSGEEQPGFVVGAYNANTVLHGVAQLFI